ncbi:MAG: protein kinase [Candidatus Riflebacteria bacterium]|nr:protein kinase [Candidatus Riflebacteria bacterium]
MLRWRVDHDVARFVREAKLLSTLSHPRIVRVFDAGLDGEIPWIVCELVEGPTVAERHSRNGCLLRDALSIAHQVADALSFAHDRGVIHRDVKPSNVFICSGEGAKLADFGLARPIVGGQTVTAKDLLLGTPAYMSPEQVTGRRLGVQTDQYSLALMLYELLSGQLPFEGETAFALAMARVAGPGVSLETRAPWVPDEVLRLVARALDPDPGRRFRSTAELCASLKRALDHTTDTGLAARRPDPRRVDADRTVVVPDAGARPLRPAPDTPQAVRREGRFGRPARIVALAAVLVVATVLGLGGLRRHRAGAPDRAGTPSAESAPGRPGRFAGTEFPRHRRLSVAVDGTFSRGVRFEAREGRAVVARGSREGGGGRVIFEDLPPSRELIVAAMEPDGREVARLGPIRTPPVTPLYSFACAPGTTSVMVSFVVVDPVELTVQVSVAGTGPVVESRRHRRGTRFFRAVFSGLRPGTDHLVRVTNGDGWGGVADWPFRTAPWGSKSGLRKIVEQCDETGLLTSVADETLWESPDLDALAPLRRALSAERTRQFIPLYLAGRAAKFWRSSEAVADLLPLVLRASDQGNLYSVLQAGVASWNLEAVRLASARPALSAPEDTWALAARAVATAGGPAACDKLASWREGRDGWVDSDYADQMVRCDRDRARERCGRWMDSPAMRGVTIADTAIRGLELLGEPQDVALLGRHLGSFRQPFAMARAMEGLARIGSPEARELLLAGLRAEPHSPFLLWPVARLGLVEAGQILVDRLKRSPDAKARRENALALGLHGDARLADALRGLLGDRDLTVVNAAAWALAALGDRASVPALMALVSGGNDRMGAATYALWRLGATRALPLLEEALIRRSRPGTGEELTAFTLAALAVLRLGDRRAEELVRGLDRGPHLPGHVRALLKEMAREPAPAAPVRELFLLPLCPWLRSGIHLQPGDWVHVTASGWWARPGGPPTLPCEKILSWPGGSEMRLTVVIGAQLETIRQCGRPVRILATRQGELCFNALPFALGSLRDVPLGGIPGVTRIRVSR